MASTIKIKNSSTSGAVPGTGDLVQGELAINVTDRSIYTENASGTVVKLNAPSIDDKNTGATKHVTIDTSGNLGLGATPSAWGSSYKALQITPRVGLFGNTSDTILGNNLYNDGTNWKYIATATGGLYLQGSGIHAWYSAASGTAGATASLTQAMTLDASGNLGVGTSSPGTVLDVQAATAIVRATSSTGTNGTTFRAVNTGGTSYFGRDSSAGGFAAAYATLVWGTGAYPIVFATNDAERARIDSSGNLLVGTTSTVNSSKFSLVGDFYNGNGQSIKTTNDGSGAQFLAFLNSSGTVIGAVNRVSTTNAVAYNTTSDERLKSNIEAAAPVLDKLMQVQVRQYDWTEGNLHQDYGFIAQELEPVLSGVVTKGKTEEDVWQLDYSRLTPHLLKAIQEQQALITQLQADVAALKAA